MTDATPLASEQITQALDKALYLAVCTLAFHGRDRGTDRQERMLDDLEVLAKEVDPLIRDARHRIAALSASPAPVGWKLVPEKLTPEMHEAVVRLDFTATHDPLWSEYWATILAASPAPSGQGVSGEALPTNAVDDQGFSDAECNAVLIDGYARDADRRGWRATGDALRCAAGFIRGYDALTAKAAPAPSCAPGEVERLANEAALRMWSVHPNDLDAKGFISNRHGGQYDNPRAAYYASEIMAVVAAALSPQGLDAKEGGE